MPADPISLGVAALLGLALCTAAAIATTVLTPSPERAQITTMPLAFILLGGAIALTQINSDSLRQALVAIPGTAIAQLVEAGVRRRRHGIERRRTARRLALGGRAGRLDSRVRRSGPKPVSMGSTLLMWRTVDAFSLVPAVRRAGSDESGRGGGPPVSLPARRALL